MTQSPAGQCQTFLPSKVHSSSSSHLAASGSASLLQANKVSLSLSGGVYVLALCMQLLCAEDETENVAHWPIAIESVKLKVHIRTNTSANSTHTHTHKNAANADFHGYQPFKQPSERASDLMRERASVLDSRTDLCAKQSLTELCCNGVLFALERERERKPLRCVYEELLALLANQARSRLLCVKVAAPFHVGGPQGEPAQLASGSKALLAACFS